MLLNGFQRAAGHAGGEAAEHLGSNRLVERFPRHVAIIMDGNGRWAHSRGWPRIKGHRRGVEAVRRATRFAVARGLEYLTLFCFSSENWSRPDDEVEGLLSLIRMFIRGDLAELQGNGVRIRVIGRREGIPADIHQLIEEAEISTCRNRGLNLVVAFNYGGRDEIIRATKSLVQAVVRRDLKPEAIDQATFQRALDTAGFPDPDLIIRTSGELRLSNFLLWQSAYAELVFLPVLWPDFGENDFDAALTYFSSRERRYGGLTDNGNENNGTQVDPG